MGMRTLLNQWSLKGCRRGCVRPSDAFEPKIALSRAFLEVPLAPPTLACIAGSGSRSGSWVIAFSSTLSVCRFAVRSRGLSFYSNTGLSGRTRADKLGETRLCLDCQFTECRGRLPLPVFLNASSASMHNSQFSQR